jgi:hypothetical protein
MSNSLFKKVVAGVSATAITLSLVAPVTSVSAAANAEIEAANKLANAGVINDSSANVANYKLDDNITRREMAKVMMNLAGVEVEDTCEGKFADLPAGDWGCKYAEAALAEGFVAANATFGADNNISKWESLKFILKARGIEKAEGVEPFQAAYVKAAMDNGVIAESFDDYNTSAKRGWIFTSGAAALDSEGEDDSDTELCELFGTCGDDEDNTDVDPVDPKDDEETNTDDEDEDVSTPSDVEGKLLEVELSPESPRNGERIPEDTPRVTMMKLEVSAGDEDVELQRIKLDATGFGAPEYIDDVVLYDAKGDKITRQRSVSKSTQNAELDFIDNFTVKAGTTQTLTVSVSIDATAKNGDVFGLKVSELEASATVKGLPVESAALESVELASQGVLKIKEDEATQDVKVGEDSKLGGFKIKVEDDEEDMTLKTIRIQQNGSIDEDNISDMYLNVDGKKLIDNLTFKGEYVTINFGEGYVFDKDKTSYVYFELRGTVSGDPADTIKFEIEETDDIYAVGNKNGYNVPVKDDTNNLVESFKLTDNNGLLVEGSEISVDFVKSEKDGTNVDTDDFDFGTLKIKANSGNYNLAEYKITVTINTANVSPIQNVTADELLEDIRLGGISAEKDLTLVGAANNEVYEVEFKDISLSKGEAKELKLTADIPKDAAYNTTYKFDLSFKDNKFKIEDEDTNTDYDIVSAGTGDARDILSSYSGFDSRKVEIETPTLEFDNTNIDSEDVVLGDVTVKSYKGTIEAGSAADVRVRQLVFENAASNNVADLEEIIQSATLRIGSVEEKTTDINATTITFNNLDQTIKAGASNKQNIEVLVQFKDADSSAIGVNADEVALSLYSYDAEDKDTGSDISATNIADDISNTITIATAGSLSIDIDTTDDSSSERKDLTHKDRFLLAGAESQILARVEMDSDKEAVKVKDLTFKSATFTTGTVNSYDQAVNFKNSFENVRLVKEDKTTVVGNVGNFEAVNPAGTTSDNDEYVKAYLEDMDLVVNTENKQVYFLMADVKKIDLDPESASATSGSNTTFTLDNTAGSYRVDGENSGDEFTSGTELTLGTAASKKVTVIASDVATISIAKINTTPVVDGYVDIARITIDDKNSVNVDADDNSINPALKRLLFSSSDITVSGISGGGLANPAYVLRLREDDSGATSDAVHANDNATFDFDNLNTAAKLGGNAEIEGKTEFILELMVDGTLGTTEIDAQAKASVRLDREDMEFVDGATPKAAVTAVKASIDDSATSGLTFTADTAGTAGNNIDIVIVDGGNCDIANADCTVVAGNTITITADLDDANGDDTDNDPITYAMIEAELNAKAAATALIDITGTAANNAAARTIEPTGGVDAAAAYLDGQVFNKVYDTGAEVNAD